MAKGRYDRWSNVSVTLEDDSRRIMGAETTMSEKRSDGTETKRGKEKIFKLTCTLYLDLLENTGTNHYLSND